MICPSEIDYSYKRLFDKDCIQIKSYPLETVMADLKVGSFAEKTEIENDKTMQSRWKSFAKTRPYATGLIFETVCNSVRDLLICSEYLESN